MRGLFHRHDWQIVGLDHGRTVYMYGPSKVHGGNATLVKYRCATCPAIDTEQMPGTWTMRELTGVDEPDGRQR